jgi:hypothetical protein
MCHLAQVCFVLVGFAAVSSPAGNAWGGPILKLAAELGPELDTNAMRVPSSSGEPEIRGGLMRLTGSGALTARVGSRMLLALDYGGGGKLFVNDAARAADELVQHGGLGWSMHVPFGGFWLGGSYYDAVQRVSSRDFRTGLVGAQIALHHLPGGLRATFDFGYRGLQYKPLDDYSFHAAEGGLSVVWDLTSGRGDAAVDWKLRFTYSGGVRFYKGNVVSLPARCKADGGQFPCLEDTPRQDVHHLARAEVMYLGSVDATLAYSAEENRSNSYGETFTRHTVGLRFTAGMAWGLFLTAKGTVQLSYFQDPFLLSQVSGVSFVSIDDENRSNLIVQLARDIGDSWSINLRYGLYVNESSPQGSPHIPLSLEAGGFLRHMLFLGARFEHSYGK